MSINAKQLLEQWFQTVDMFNSEHEVIGISEQEWARLEKAFEIAITQVQRETREACAKAVKAEYEIEYQLRQEANRVASFDEAKRHDYAGAVLSKLEANVRAPHV